MQTETTIKFQHVRLNLVAVNQAASQLTDSIGLTLVDTTKQALVTLGAVASRGTLRSIRQRRVGTRGISTRTQGLYHRQVVGGKGLKFIISGRRAGAPMPVHMVGMGKRGKIFAPLPEMLKWLNIVGIPRDKWFAVMRSISRRGIAPRNVPKLAVQLAKPMILNHARVAGNQIARGIIVRAS